VGPFLGVLRKNYPDNNPTVLAAKEAAALATAEAQKAGQAIDQGVNRAAGAVNQGRQAVDNTVAQAQAAAQNSKLICSPASGSGLGSFSLIDY